MENRIIKGAKLDFSSMVRKEHIYRHREELDIRRYNYRLIKDEHTPSAPYDSVYAPINEGGTARIVCSDESVKEHEYLAVLPSPPVSLDYDSQSRLYTLTIYDEGGVTYYQSGGRPSLMGTYGNRFELRGGSGGSYYYRPLSVVHGIIVEDQSGISPSSHFANANLDSEGGMYSVGLDFWERNFARALEVQVIQT